MSNRRYRRAWALGWLGAAGIAVGNGAVREIGYADRVGQVPAAQISTVSLLVLLTAYIWWLQRHWPLPATSALRVGLAWVAAMLAFELGLGHFVEHKSWATLLADYDITSGRVWVLVPIWTAVAPAVLRRIQQRRSSDRSTASVA